MQTHPFEKAGLGKAPFRCIGYELQLFVAYPGATPRAGASCDYCGTSIANVFKIKGSGPNDVTFKVGCDCVAKTADRDLIVAVKANQKERRAVAKQARNEARAARRTSTAAERFAALPAALHEAFNDCDHPIVADVARRAREHGSVTPRQADLVLRLYAEYIGRRDAVGCALPPPVAAPVSAERVTLEGVILGTRAQESMYGTVLKMLIAFRTPLGQWKAWSTVPQFAYDQRQAEGRESLKGMRLALTARVEPSKDDPCFAFLSRPTAPKVAKPRKNKAA